eukprot:536889-Rhodomonas_salina.1
MPLILPRRAPRQNQMPQHPVSVHFVPGMRTNAFDSAGFAASSLRPLSRSQLRYPPTRAYAMSGTDLAYGATLCGTDLAYGATHPRPPARCPLHCAVLLSGTDLAYAPTQLLIALLIFGNFVCDVTETQMLGPSTAL